MDQNLMGQGTETLRDLMFSFFVLGNMRDAEACRNILQTRSDFVPRSLFEQSMRNCCFVMGD